MWKIEVAQEYKTDSRYTCSDTTVFATEDLKCAEDVISIFEKYGVGVVGYTITRKGEKK